MHIHWLLLFVYYWNSSPLQCAHQKKSQLLYWCRYFMTSKLWIMQLNQYYGAGQLMPRTEGSIFTQLHTPEKQISNECTVLLTGLNLCCHALCRLILKPISLGCWSLLILWSLTLSVSFFLFYQDKTLMQSKHLVVNQPLAHPFDFYQSPDGCLGECHTGYVYQNLYIRHIQHPCQQLLCPLIPYMDQTNVDKFGPFQLEPFSSRKWFEFLCCPCPWLAHAVAFLQPLV